VPGEVIAGRYELVSPIGAGAMGWVWAAKHVALGSSVAIKFLHPETVASEEARLRFAREARIAATLGERCRYVVRVIDYGVVDEVGPFLVMEYLRGEELATKLRREGRVSLFDTVHIVAQLCRALAVAHHKGVVHRDVKPGNVFLARPHTNMAVFVKLMDFGVAKLLDGAGAESAPPSTTRVGAVIGTPSYMSPEQLLAQPVDHRSDLWGVATTVYRILTGELPFGNGTLAEMGVRIVTLMPRPPSEVVPALPKAIDVWMTKALAKSPDDRFQSAREMAEAFAAAAGVDLGGFGIMPRAIHPTPVPSSDPAPLDSGVRPAASVEPITVRALDRQLSGTQPVQAPASRDGGRLKAGLAVTTMALALVGLVGLSRGPHEVKVEASLTADPVVPSVAAPPAPVPSVTVVEPQPSASVRPLKLKLREIKLPKPAKN